MSCSEAKPYSVVRHRESTPPTTAASMVPSCNWRAAAANTLALDEQALDRLMAMPSMPKASRTKALTEWMLWVCS